MPPKPKRRQPQGEVSEDTDDALGDIGWGSTVPTADHFDLSSLVQTVEIPSSKTRNRSKKTKKNVEELPEAIEETEDEKRESKRPRTPNSTDVDDIKRRKMISVQPSEGLLRVWHAAEVDGDYRLEEEVYWGLVQMGLTEGPMPIQKRVFKEAVMNRKDIIVAAPTGSGKTLAYLIPVISTLLTNIKGRMKLQTAGKIEGSLRRRLEALIVVPSRELAHQVGGVAQALTSPLRNIGGDLSVETTVLIGGLSHQKQVRVMDKLQPHLVVGTPGRIWGMTFGTHIDHGKTQRWERPSTFFQDWNDLRFLVIDEADAMTDAKKGEFEQLERILEKIRIKKKKGLKRLQTFIVSATLAVPPHLKKQFPKLQMKEVSRKKGAKGELSAAERIVSQANLRSGEDELFVCDMSTQKAPQGIHSTDDPMHTKGLTKTGLALPEKLVFERDSFDPKHDEERLYLHLLRHFQHDKGQKAIIFVRNKARVFRLTQLLKLLFGDDRGDFNRPELKVPLERMAQRASVVGLMGDAKQADRLKKFEEFASPVIDRPRILVCTDGTAARGIDIPDLGLVIHFHCPLNTSIFVHRSGRTARGRDASGKVLCMDCEPKTAGLWRAVFEGVKMNFEKDATPVDWIDRLNRHQREQTRDVVKVAQNLTKLVDSERNRKKKKQEIQRMATDADLDDGGGAFVDSDDEEQEHRKAAAIGDLKIVLYSNLEPVVFQKEPLWKQRQQRMQK